VVYGASICSISEHNSMGFFGVKKKTSISLDNTKLEFMSMTVLASSGNNQLFLFILDYPEVFHYKSKQLAGRA